VALVRDRADVLLRKAEADGLHELLAEQAQIRFDARTGVSEVNSWRQSLPALLGDLRDAGLDHVEVLLEHRLPYSPKRVDALLCGLHPKTHRPYSSAALTISIGWPLCPHRRLLSRGCARGLLTMATRPGSPRGIADRGAIRSSSRAPRHWSTTS
jgi:hypothetical protein